MPHTKRKELQYQCDSWKRLLVFLREENAHTKNRLSMLVKEGVEVEVLDTLEYFQNRFIKEDELITLLRDQVTQFDDLLTREIYQNTNGTKPPDKQFKKIRLNIEATEQAFSKLLSDFNNYLLANSSE